MVRPTSRGLPSESMVMGVMSASHEICAARLREMGPSQGILPQGLRPGGTPSRPAATPVVVAPFMLVLVGGGGEVVGVDEDVDVGSFAAFGGCLA